MKDKIKLEFNDVELTSINNALNSFRNHLNTQKRATEIVDEIILKINNSSKVELNECDVKIIINALDTYRYKLKNENKPRGEVNDVILRLIDETNGKKKLILKKIGLGNARY